MTRNVLKKFARSLRSILSRTGKNLKQKSDEETLGEFINLLKTRVSIATNFVVDDDGNLTDQILHIRCGEFVVTSEPEPLDVVLRPATGTEIGATVN